MVKGRRTGWMALGALLVVMLVAPVAWAQPSAEQVARAKEHFRKGEAHYRAGAYQEAIAEYQAAFEAAPLPALRFNIAQAARLAGDKKRARDEYLAFVELAPDHQLADEARRHIAELTRDLERERAEQPPTVGRPPKPVERLVVVERDPHTVTRTRSRGLRVAGLVTAGVGLVAIGAGVYFGLDARTIADDLSNTTGMWTDAELDRQQDGKRSERLMYVFTGLGGAAAIAGTAMFLYGSSKVEVPANLALDIAPERASLMVTGRF